MHACHLHMHVGVHTFYDIASSDCPGIFSKYQYQDWTYFLLVSQNCHLQSDTISRLQSENLNLNLSLEWGIRSCGICSRTFPGTEDACNLTVLILSVLYDQIHCSL